jgi:sporulation protein YlmC with PRC-barrel domain
VKKLVLLTAVSGLLVTSALAQTSTAPGPNAPQSPPAAAGTPSNGPSSAAGTVQIVTAQTADQWLASKFTGTNVTGADGVKIGSVSDVLFQRDGKVLAYVVSVGGFLGMGSKEVALAPDAFQVQPGQNATDFTLKVAMTKDQLKNAPAFEPYKAPAAPTTGMSPPPSNRPTGAPPRPTGSAQ